MLASRCPLHRAANSRGVPKPSRIESEIRSIALFLPTERSKHSVGCRDTTGRRPQAPRRGTPGPSKFRLFAMTCPTLSSTPPALGGPTLPPINVFVPQPYVLRAALSTPSDSSAYSVSGSGRLIQKVTITPIAIPATIHGRAFISTSRNVGCKCKMQSRCHTQRR